MRPLLWLIATATVSWLAMSGAGAPHPETGFGMLAPLAAVCVTWVLARRTYTTRPERLTSVLILALAGKMVFFGVYVVVMVRMLALRPTPFMASFTGYFIVLYAMEAFFLRRLFVDGMRS